MVYSVGMMANSTARSHNKTDGKLMMGGGVRATINNEGGVRRVELYLPPSTISRCSPLDVENVCQLSGSSHQEQGFTMTQGDRVPLARRLPRQFVDALNS